MKKLLVISVILSFQFSLSHAQTVYPSLITPLPIILFESSGIEVNHKNNIWTHNDSGDSARIFNIDTLGNLLRTLYLSIDTAIDFEDVTQDNNGNYYIGDFGNNLNNRTDLKIYKIPNPDLISTDTVVPQIISFNYPDQNSFPPDSSQRNFDCEATFHFNDSLYIFSKNRGASPFCKMYRLPDLPGNYTAVLVDSFNTGNWITSADISPSEKTMVLLSETRIWLFTGFTNTNFFGGSAQQLYMNISQKEAIVFVNDSLVYITDEKFFNIGGNLYSLDLGLWINSVNDFSQTRKAFITYPNPAYDQITFSLGLDNSPFTIEVYNILGEVKIRSTEKSQINISDLASGLYFITAYQANKIYFTKFIKN